MEMWEIFWQPTRWEASVSTLMAHHFKESISIIIIIIAAL